MTLLDVTGLKTQFHTNRGTVKAVDNVDLSIGEGEIVGLVGESGSGKSVFAESIMRLVEDPGEIVEGNINLQGESILDKTEKEMQKIRGNRVSMVFQDPMNSLNPTLTIGEQIAEAIRLHKPEVNESVTLPSEIKRKLIGSSTNSEAWRRAIRMLESVQIPEPTARASDFPFEFSGGMRQRAMIAMALSCEPDLLIADEPTTALDVTIEAQILDELREIRDEFNTSILLITHDLAVVSEVCERVNVMYAGEIVERGTARELFNNPQHPYMQSLLKSIPSSDNSTEQLDPISGNVPDLIDIPYACHFAPRCPEAKRECYEVEPDYRNVGAEDHEAACLRRGPEEDQI